MQRLLPDTIHTMTSHRKNSRTHLQQCVRSVIKHLRVKMKLFSRMSQSKVVVISDTSVKTTNKTVQMNPKTDFKPTARHRLCHFLPLRIWNFRQSSRVGNKPWPTPSQQIFSLDSFDKKHSLSLRLSSGNPKRASGDREKLSLINNRGQWGQKVKQGRICAVSWVNICLSAETQMRCVCVWSLCMQNLPS